MDMILGVLAFVGAAASLAVFGYNMIKFNRGGFDPHSHSEWGQTLRVHSPTNR